MKALILAAGKGSRLRPLTDYIPKPMVPLQGKPLLEWAMLPLIAWGVKEFIITTSYLAEQIKSYFGKGEKWGIKIDYTYGVSPAGKAGEVWRAKDLLEGEEPFLVVPGDTICHLNYREFFDFHHKHGGLVSIAFSTNYQLEVGIAEIDKNNLVKRFLEKPNLNKPISTGAYLLDQRIFPYIEIFSPENQEVDLPGDVFPHLMEKGIPLYGYVEDYSWWDVGRLNDYESLVKLSPQEAKKILPWSDDCGNF